MNLVSYVESQNDNMLEVSLHEIEKSIHTAIQKGVTVMNTLATIQYKFDLQIAENIFNNEVYEELMKKREVISFMITTNPAITFTRLLKELNVHKKTNGIGDSGGEQLTISFEGLGRNRGLIN